LSGAADAGMTDAHENAAAVNAKTKWRDLTNKLSAGKYTQTAGRSEAAPWLRPNMARNRY
jgi:hypothetical protein